MSIFETMNYMVVIPWVLAVILMVVIYIVKPNSIIKLFLGFASIMTLIGFGIIMNASVFYQTNTVTYKGDAFVTMVDGTPEFKLKVTNRNLDKIYDNVIYDGTYFTIAVPLDSDYSSGYIDIDDVDGLKGEFKRLDVTTYSTTNPLLRDRVEYKIVSDEGDFTISK